MSVLGAGECNCLTAEKYIEKYNDWCKEFENYQRAYNEWEILRDQVRRDGTFVLLAQRCLRSFRVVQNLDTDRICT